MAKNTGLKINRKYTSPGDPYKDIVWEKRSSKIANPDGSVVFEMNDVEIPSTWSQVATDIMVSKYFRKAGVPQVDENGKELLDENGEKVLGLGASTKGNILLQHFGLTKKEIPFISEINKFKIGLKCIGTDIKLISEKDAKLLKPDLMLVLPWYFKDEILKREKNFLKKGGKLFFPMPYPHIITSKGEQKLYN